MKFSKNFSYQAIVAHKQFNRKDRFYVKAKKEGYPARSAYKIMELDDRFKIFKPGSVIVDLGCAPGGWLMVAEERLNGKGTLVGIDLLPLKFQPKPATHFLQGDFTTDESQKWLADRIPNKADWIISDMSPNISGVKFRDQFDSVELCRKAMFFATQHLKANGSFLCKLFPGQEVEEFREELKQHFSKLKTVVPEATRQSSTEIYVVAQGLK